MGHMLWWVSISASAGQPIKLEASFRLAYFETRMDLGFLEQQNMIMKGGVVGKWVGWGWGWGGCSTQLGVSGCGPKRKTLTGTETDCVVLKVALDGVLINCELDGAYTQPHHTTPHHINGDEHSHSEGGGGASPHSIQKVSIIVKFHQGHFLYSNWKWIASNSELCLSRPPAKPTLPLPLSPSLITVIIVQQGPTFPQCR